MIDIKEACQIVLNEKPQASFFDAFEYKDLYIFHMFDGKAWTKGSSLDYYMSVNKNNKNCKIFSDWKESFNNPDEYIPASEKKILPEQFLS